VLFPAYSKLQNNFKQLRELYLTMVDLISKVTFPALIGIFILSKEIILFVYGSNWVNSIGVLKILCILAAIRSISSVNGYVYNAIGKPFISFYLNLSKLIIVLLLIYPLTKTYGIIGAAYSIMVPTLITFPITVYIMKKVLNLHLATYYLILLKNLCASLIMSISIVFTSIYLPIESIYHLLGFVLFGIIIYGLLNIRFIFFAIKNKRVPMLSGRY
jgi:O-antigen/teichoic acid export membrane protein